MVNVFTHKRYLGNRIVIYEPEEYFKTRVVESVRQGLYELSAEAKALIASEGVTKLEKDSITTKYGDMKLEDISWLSKMLIVMEFMHDLSYDEVINITHNGQHLESLLKQAEKYGIDVFMSFQFCSESWRHINVAVRFNGDLMEHRMGNMLINIACDFAPCNGIESETRLQFKGTNSEYDLFIPTSRLTLTVDNSFQMKKFMDDLKVAVENGNIYTLYGAELVSGMNFETYYEESSAYEPVPFVPAYLHGQIHYTGIAVDAGDPLYRYDMLRLIEYGALPFYEWIYENKNIFCYSGYLLNDRAGEIADFYNDAKEIFTPLAKETITDHRKIEKDSDGKTLSGVYCTTYSDGTEIYVNYTGSIIQTPGNIAIGPYDFVAVKR